MILTLLRHGKAVDREAWHGDDRDRPLTREGLSQLRTMLKAMAGAIQAEELWTSPWKRARQTAELAAELWDLPLTEQPWLAGAASEPLDWCRQLRAGGDVGHLLGHLLGGRPMPVKKGGIAILDGQPRPAQMELRLLVAPRHALAITGP
jgi:phosphohistidine phosphatase